MPNNLNGTEPHSMIQGFFRACLMVLVSVVALWVAIKLLAQIWGWLLLIVAIASAIWITIAILTARRRRW